MGQNLMGHLHLRPDGNRAIPSVLVLALLLLAGLTFILPVGIVHAVGPTLANNNACSSSGGLGTSTICTIPIASNGDYEIALILDGNSGNTCPVGAITSVVSTANGPLTLLKDSGCASLGGTAPTTFENYIYAITSPSSSVSDIVTFNYNANANHFISFTLYDYFGLAVNEMDVATSQNGTVACNISCTLTATAISNPGDGAVAMSYASNAGYTGVTAGWNSLGPCTTTACRYEHAETTIPASYGFTASGGFVSDGWNILGASFGSSQTVTTITQTTVVAPSSTSLNYWYFSILFLGLYDSFFLAEGALAKVSTKGMIYLLLSGFVLGTIIGLLMGFVAIQLVILSIVTLIVWFWRFH